jgi:hypothetical protein
VDVNCLVLDPELIFINAQDELFFVAYPFHKGNLAIELQQLMEYMLTKLDHKDTTAVGWAYKLYEMSLMEGISIAEFKRVILEERSRRVFPQDEHIVREEVSEAKELVEPKIFTPESLKQKIQDMLKGLLSTWKNRFQTKVNEYIPVVVYPEELEILIANLPYVLENMVFGIPETDDDLTLAVKIVYNEEMFVDLSKEEIEHKIWADIKEINGTLTTYKHMKKLVITTEPMVKTTTNKVKRNIEIAKTLQEMNG